MLIAAANPCRCGYAFDPQRACAKLPACMNDYMGRISGPLMDRFDLRIEVPPVHFSDLNLPSDGESSADIAHRVASARAVQDARFAAQAQVRTNADAGGKDLEDMTILSSESRAMLMEGAERFGLSARGYHRILRVARTIADLAGTELIAPPHVAEALSYRLSGS
jgi:magnesium chelatase family protein